MYCLTIYLTITLMKYFIYFNYYIKLYKLNKVINYNILIIETSQSISLFTNA